MPWNDPTAPTAADSDVTTLAKDNTAFAFDLFAELGKAEGNLAFSPYSATAALNLAYAAAHSETPTQNLSDAPDHDVVTLARKGDEAAFRKMLRRYERPVYDLIHGTVGIRELAEDLTRETFGSEDAQTA